MATTLEVPIRSSKLTQNAFTERHFVMTYHYGVLCNRDNIAECADLQIAHRVVK